MPSGNILRDAELDTYLCGQLFDEEFEFTVIGDQSVTVSKSHHFRFDNSEALSNNFGKKSVASKIQSRRNIGKLKKMQTFNAGDQVPAPENDATVLDDRFSYISSIRGSVKHIENGLVSPRKCSDNIEDSNQTHFHSLASTLRQKETTMSLKSIPMEENSSSPLGTGRFSPTKLKFNQMTLMPLDLDAIPQATSEDGRDNESATSGLTPMRKKKFSHKDTKESKELCCDDSSSPAKTQSKNQTDSAQNSKSFNNDPFDIQNSDHSKTLVKPMVKAASHFEINKVVETSVLDFKILMPDRFDFSPDKTQDKFDKPELNILAPQPPEKVVTNLSSKIVKEEEIREKKSSQASSTNPNKLVKRKTVPVETDKSDSEIKKENKASKPGFLTDRSAPRAQLLSSNEDHLTNYQQWTLKRAELLKKEVSQEKKSRNQTLTREENLYHENSSKKEATETEKEAHQIAWTPCKGFSKLPEIPKRLLLGTSLGSSILKRQEGKEDGSFQLSYQKTKAKTAEKPLMNAISISQVNPGSNIMAGPLLSLQKQTSHTDLLQSSSNDFDLEHRDSFRLHKTEDNGTNQKLQNEPEEDFDLLEDQLKYTSHAFKPVKNETFSEGFQHIKQRFEKFRKNKTRQMIQNEDPYSQQTYAPNKASKPTGWGRISNNYDSGISGAGSNLSSMAHSENKNAKRHTSKSPSEIEKEIGDYKSTLRSGKQNLKGGDAFSKVSAFLKLKNISDTSGTSPILIKGSKEKKENSIKSSYYQEEKKENNRSFSSSSKPRSSNRFGSSLLTNIKGRKSTSKTPPHKGQSFTTIFNRGNPGVDHSVYNQTNLKIEENFTVYKSFKPNTSVLNQKADLFKDQSSPQNDISTSLPKKRVLPLSRTTVETGIKNLRKTVQKKTQNMNISALSNLNCSQINKNKRPSLSPSLNPLIPAKAEKADKDKKSHPRTADRHLKEEKEKPSSQKEPQSALSKSTILNSLLSNIGGSSGRRATHKTQH